MSAPLPLDTVSPPTAGPLPALLDQTPEALRGKLKLAPAPGNQILDITARAGSAAEARKAPQLLSGIQAWVALPRSHEEGDPAFVHHAADELPLLSDNGVSLRLIAGEAMGARSPVQTPMAMFQADLQLAPGASAPLDATYEERALYTVSGTVEIAGDCFGPGQVRVDGRKIHPAYLFDVKKPEESKGAWDYYKLVGTVSADQAFRPLNEGGCALVK